MKKFWVLVLVVLIGAGLWLVFHGRGTRGLVEEDFADGSIVRSTTEHMNPFGSVDTELSPDAVIDVVHEVEVYLLLKQGLLYADSFSGRRLREKQPALQMPRIQVNLLMETDGGKFVPLMTLGHGHFQWATDQFFSKEYQSRPGKDGVRNFVGFDLFADIVKDRESWMMNKRINYDLAQQRPLGVKSISVAVLPVDFVKRFPELGESSEDIRKYGRFLRAGAWYELNVYVYDVFWEKGVVQLPARALGNWHKTYIRVPEMDQLELGKVIEMDHVVRRNAKEPIAFTHLRRKK